MKLKKGGGRSGYKLETSVIAFALIIQISLPPFAFGGGGNCEYRPNRMKALVDISATGQEKLAKIAYEQERRSLNDDLAGLADQPVSLLNPDPVKCGMRNIRKYYKTADSAAKACGGIIPTVGWLKSPGDPRQDDESWGDYLEPLRVTAEHPRLSMELGSDPKISCQHDVCSIEAPIEKLEARALARIGSVNESCDAVHRNATITLDSENKPRPAMVRAKFRYTSDLNKPIEMIPEGTDVVVPVQDLKFSVDKAPKIQPRATYARRRPSSRSRTARPAAATLAPGGVCSQDTDINDVAPIFLEYLSSMITSNQLVMNQIIDKAKEQISNGWLNKMIAKVAQANGVGQDKQMSTYIPRVRDIADSSALKLSVDNQLNLADDLIRSVGSTASSSQGTLSSFIDRMNTAFNDFIRSFSESHASDSANTVKQVADKWESVAQALESQPQTPETQQKLASIRNAINDMRNLEAELQLQFVKDKEPIDVLAAALRANELQGDIEVLLNACFKCRNYNIQDSTTGNTGFDHSRDYDLAVKTGYGTINQFLNYMKDSDHLDFCISGKVERACSAIQANDDALQLHFGSPPELSLGSEPGTVAITLKQLQIKAQNNIASKIGRDIQADLTIQGTLSLDSSGNTLNFTPTSQTKINNVNFSNGDYGFLSSIAAFVAEHLAKGSIGTSVLKGPLTKSIGLPPQMQVTAVYPGRDGMAVYTKLPDDPSAILGDARNGARFR